MKKHYSNLILFLFFGLIAGFKSIAQPITAAPNTATVTHSAGVQIAIQNVLNNDTFNGLPVSLSQVTLTQVSATAHISLQSNGSVTVNAGAPNGYHELSYRICDINNATNCATTFAAVTIVSAPIVVGPDAVTISTGLVSPQIILENVLSNDTLGGVPISVSNVTIRQTSSTATSYFNIDPANGNVVQISNPSPGNYTLNYSYCQIGNANNCTQASVAITVLNSLATNIVATYVDYNGDGITNVGDVINYTYSITNTGSVAVSNISINSVDVNINGGPPIPILNAGANDSTTFTGAHPITQYDINTRTVIVAIQTNGTRSGTPISISTTNTFNLNISNGIKLNAFIDYNSNGAQEAGEPSVNYGTFQYQLNDNGITHEITSSDGTFYLYETNTSNSYDFGYALSPQFASQYNVTPANYSNITVPNGSGVVSYNFALSARNPYTDLGVYVYCPSMPRPGFTYQAHVTITNYGNQTIGAGTVTFTRDNVLTINSISPMTGVTPTTNGFTHNFTNLLPGQTRTIVVNMTVPTIPTVSLGNWLTNSVTATIPPGDANTYNNDSSNTQIIVGSYDPNDKTESHGPQIQHSTFNADDYLTYTIRFENTGTAEAINIRVEDILDAKLDETSVKMVASSHPYVLDRVGRNLTWKFGGVNLEPSIPGNSVIGHGFIVFQVKPKSGFVIGDVIPNIASIYFDFNPPIVTDPWTTTFVPFLGINTHAFDNFTYHPNPVDHTLMISNNSIIETAEITSILGQKIRSVKVNALQTEIDMSGLTSGVYFVKVAAEGNEKTVKVIKR